MRRYADTKKYKNRVDKLGNVMSKTSCCVICRTQFARASLGDQVMVTPFQPPKHSFEASLVVAEIKRVSKKVSPLELEAEDVVAHVTSRLAYTVRNIAYLLSLELELEYIPWDIYPSCSTVCMHHECCLLFRLLVCISLSLEVRLN